MTSSVDTKTSEKKRVLPSHPCVNVLPDTKKWCDVPHGFILAKPLPGNINLLFPETKEMEYKFIEWMYRHGHLEYLKLTDAFGDGNMSMLQLALQFLQDPSTPEYGMQVYDRVTSYCDTGLEVPADNQHGPVYEAKGVDGAILKFYTAPEQCHL